MCVDVLTYTSVHTRCKNHTGGAGGLRGGPEAVRGPQQGIYRWMDGWM